MQAHVSRGLFPAASALQVGLSSLWTRQLSSASAAPLAYEEVIGHPENKAQGTAAAHTPTAVLLHGLLGSGRNWRSFAKRLVDEAAAKQGRSWRMVLVDLRNHGSSSLLPGLHPPHSMEAAAGDVVKLMQQLLPREQPSPFALIGHSLGGKVALEALRLMSEAKHKLPMQTWVLDSQPGTVPDDMEAKAGVAHVLRLVHDVVVPVASRQALLDYLRKQRGMSEALSLWLGSNLVADARGRLVWSFNVQGAAAMYQSYRVTDCWGALERPPAGSEVHLVRGERSDRWSPDMLRRLEAAALSRKDGAPTSGHGAFHYHTLEKAGHWLHTDNGPGLHKLMLQHMLQ